MKPFDELFPFVIVFSKFGLVFSDLTEAKLNLLCIDILRKLYNLNKDTNVSY